MALVDRARNMIVRPALEWPVIAMEPTVPSTLYTGYVIPLALIGPVCALASNAVFLGHPIVGLVTAALSFALELAYVFLAALIAQSLAPNFGGANDRLSGLKWIAYGYTPRWVAGIALLIPIFGSLILLVASLYSLYVLYLGAGPVMRVPPDKTIGFVAVVVIVLIVIGIIVSAIIGVAAAAVLLSTGAAVGAFSH